MFSQQLVLIVSFIFLILTLLHLFVIKCLLSLNFIIKTEVKIVYVLNGIELWCCVHFPAKMAWKRAVQGVREMCDVCDATLFNVHWVCEKCGFAVCIDCFRMRSFIREREHCRDEDCRMCEHHKRKWLTCSANRQAHETNQLTMAQIIPSDG